MQILSYVPAGYTGHLVAVEVDIRLGIPGTDIVGLAGSAVREARERVRVAVRRSGFHYPRDRVVVNLSPAGVPKSGTGLDLAIAVAILCAAGEVHSSDQHPMLVVGELGLSGAVRPVPGVLAAVSEAAERGIERFLVPAANRAEAEVVGRGRVLAAGSIEEAVGSIRSGRSPATGGRLAKPRRAAPIAASDVGDFRFVRGSRQVVRAMEIAAAGRHHLFLVGPPGSGKTLSARTFASILPPLSPSEAAEVTRVHSLAGALLPGHGLLTTPPFRSPHHSASPEGMAGGGMTPRPGELSLAHHGVLFLDEALQFKVPVLQSLRQPMETARVVIARAGGNYWFPADFQLIMATNPCPCGNLGRSDRYCLCGQLEIARYWRRLGAPILDRIDLRVAVSPFTGSLSDEPDGESSAVIRDRVGAAVDRQRHRYRHQPFDRNARVTGPTISAMGTLSAETLRVLERATRALRFSNRAQYSVLRVARTIADLEGAESVTHHHLLEAVQHRRLGEGSDYPWQ